MKEIVLVKKNQSSNIAVLDKPVEKSKEESKSNAEIEKSYPQNNDFQKENKQPYHFAERSLPQRVAVSSHFNQNYVQNKTNVAKENLAEVKNSTTIEKPNFDKIQEISPDKKIKVLKLKKELPKTENYVVAKKLKIILLAVGFCVLTAVSTFSTIQIVNVSKNIAASQTQYEASVVDLVKKINSTDAGNRSLDLFETYPEADLTASSQGISTNWFDRFCNFVSGLFGG